MTDPSPPASLAEQEARERAGLIERSRERQWRPARLQAEPLRAAAEWTLGYREFWEERYDRLDEYLEELQARRPEREKEEDDGE